MSEDKLNEVEGGALTRRGLAKAAAWGAPAVVMMGAAPCVGASTIDFPENPFGSNWLYVDQRDPGSSSPLDRGDFHYLFPDNGKAITVPKMEWTVRVVPVPNNDNLVQSDQSREVWIEEYHTSNLGNAVAFTKTTPVSGSTGDFISPLKKKAEKNADGSYTLNFTTAEVTDTRGNQIRSFGFKVYTGGASKLISRRADKLVIEGRPVLPKDDEGNPIYPCKPGTNTRFDPLWVKYDTIENASPDKRWTVGLTEEENRRRGWTQAQDGRI
ncbi:hypothetical protein KRX56_01945 [Dermabacteraceae bacterium TAE3-ERU27]|nr:hypothetical protein [Dermabacteraceae bacterium TAE3-ERU27]